MSKSSTTFSILVHYSEIGLKKNNRGFFEKKFIKNISNHIKDLIHKRIRLISARVIIEKINPQDWVIYKKRLQNVMGLSSAILMIETKCNLEKIKSTLDAIIKEKKFNSFRVTTKRHYKGFKHTSIDTNVELGSYIQKITNAEVKLSGSEINIIIEILKDKTYVGYKKVIGFSGLPACSQEKAISLLSSGIDSPVASFEMIKRGVNLSFIHFHSYPAISKQSIDNVKHLVKILTKFQLKTTLYCIPLLEIQEKIMQEVQDKYWVIFFRRSMIKIANILAYKFNHIALITGDSIGQVASQTLSNIRAISDGNNLPIIRPLSGMNKQDIITKAKQIGTYDISIKPYQDCCSHFVPIHPETKAKINNILDIDSKLDFSKEYDNALNNMEEFNMSFLEN